MLNSQSKYKGKPFGFANQEEARSIRAEIHANRRKTERTKTFNENRNILNSSINATLTEEPNIPAPVENRIARLSKWKIERDRRKKLEQAKKKRPFVVGKVHHKIYSPITKDEHITSIVSSKKICKSKEPKVPLIPEKRITRATEKRLIYKAQLNKTTNVSTKTDHSVKNKLPKISKTQEQSFAPADYKFKVPENLKRLPLFGRVTNSINFSFNESLTSFARVSRVSRESCVTNSPAQPIKSTALNTSYTIEEKRINSTLLNTSYTIEKKQDDDDNIGEDSIEPIVLKLSSDDENVFNSPNRCTRQSIKNNDNNSNNVSKKDTQTNDKFNDSERSKKLNNSKKNKKLNDSKKNKKVNNSEKNEKFINSKKNLDDSNRSKKFNNFEKNEDMNQKLNNSYKDNESNEKHYDSNVTCNVTNSSKNKDTHDIVKDTSEETQPSGNNDKSVRDFSNEPFFPQPCVVSSRGKTNARKEQEMKCGFNLKCTTNDYIPTNEIVTTNLNILAEEEECTAQYFEFLLNKEIDRQSQLCEKWTKLKEEPGITEDAQYQINQAIGQTNLLMNKKFVRFRNLVSDCATGQGEMLVTCNDLQGFWDMMYIEIENCNIRFEKLEQLRSRGWEEEEVIAINRSRIRKKVAVTKKVVCTKSNGIGAFLAKRKQNMVGGTQNINDKKNPGILNNETLSSIPENNENNPNCKYKSRTPDKTRLSLLRKLQFSDTKKLKSPLTMIKISQMCKTPEIQLDNTISYINSHQTPSRSILKQSKHSNQMGSCVKSTHKVNFNGSVESKNKDAVKNLATVLAKIDNLDVDCVSNETPIHAGKKLTFNDDSFEESPNIFDVSRNSESKKYANSSMCTPKTLPTINIEDTTPLQKSMLYCESSTPLPSSRSTRQNVFCKDDESPSLNIVVSTPFKDVTDNTDLKKSKQNLKKHVSVNKEEDTAEQQSDNIRVLRNRNIIPGNTTTQKKRYSRNVSMNVQELEYKENKTPTKAKNKNLNKDSTKDDTLIHSDVDLHDAIRGMSLEEEYGRRRSSRRSVKFSEKECSGCVEKLTFSMTPHVRRSKAHSTEKKRSVVIKESIETTEKLPERVRRSKSKKA
ncbi:uncharacterized protein LOC143357796 [Halictus rubicundus]|uniref:uncharacterized protein LOC143357796 n=1 Tax=Halictus rubicundus TaxID=77578 RepID=UPI0040368787